MTDLQKITYKSTIITAFTILIGFGSVCLTLGTYLGDWREWRSVTTDKVDKLEKWKDAVQTTGLTKKTDNKIH